MLGGEGIYTTLESTEPRKIHGMTNSSVREKSMDPDEKVKGAFPILLEESCAIKQSPHRITNHLMRTLTGTILRPGTSASGLHNVVMLDKEGPGIPILARFTAEVEANNTTRGIPRGDPGKDDMEPIERQRFPSHGDTKDKCRTEIIDDTVIIVPIEANYAFCSVLVF
jgi:hypothetical protein